MTTPEEAREISANTLNELRGVRVICQARSHPRRRVIVDTLIFSRDRHLPSCGDPSRDAPDPECDGCTPDDLPWQLMAGRGTQIMSGDEIAAVGDHTRFRETVECEVCGLRADIRRESPP